MEYWEIINLTHIIFSTPLFIWIGYMKNKTHKYIFYLALVVGIIVLLYHLYKCYLNFIEGNSMYIVNLFHILVVAPLLIYAGIVREKIAYPIPSLMFILGAGGLIHYVIKYLKN